MIIEISVAVIALAFVILVIYLVVVLKASAVTLGQVNLTLVEARKIIKEADLAVADLKMKFESLNPIFHSVENVGEVLESETHAFKERKIISSHEVDEEDLAISDFVTLADVGVRLWNKFNKRRKK
jgi:uncharacterized protein YoxC